MSDNLKTTANLVKLPNGDYIDPTTVKAVRRCDPQEASEKPWQLKQVPRVIIDYLISNGNSDYMGYGHSNVIVIECETIEERDKLSVDLFKLLVTPKLVSKSI